MPVPLHNADPRTEAARGEAGRPPCAGGLLGPARRRARALREAERAAGTRPAA